MNNQIKISDYNYNLPNDKIAFYPKENRDESKLLVFNNNTIKDSVFKKLTDFLTPQDVLVFNNSKVIHARIIVYNATGARIEIFCLEPLDPTTVISQSFEQTNTVSWKCFVGNAKKWKNEISFQVVLDHQMITISANKTELTEGSFKVTFTWDSPSVTFAEWLEAYGKMPLPPYIKREADTNDNNRYQTIFAQYDGSVAAPTAGLHFTQTIFEELTHKNIQQLWITLHVGAGTFKPVSTEYISDHYMHQEQMVASKQMIRNLMNVMDKRIIAVGTTVARTLESLFIMGAKLHLNMSNPFHVEQWEVYDLNLQFQNITPIKALQSIYKYLENNNLEFLEGETSLMIIPEYKHKIAKGILTNFHQPQSTLLLLIASYIGENWRKVYQHALDHDYRFLSYGDSNLYL
jgi:S-adenosylmethionine:tRNA ribosyltransferase-isomerase